ncbi:hypothetical protein [Kitasatospora sp. KL5]|uniref:hypothetical protein n=1 Tax=Kitasatospora sp. KL5 TaxID=3425125 RepID=UPI003D6DE5FC
MLGRHLFWRADLAHYVERYHLRLPPAFLEHAAANGWVPPCPDERQTDALLGDAGSG